MISFESLRAPKPMAIVVVWEGQDLHVTYDRAAFTIEMTEGVYAMPIRRRLSRVLLGWDLTRASVSWQPPPKDDPNWDTLIQADRLRAVKARHASALEGDLPAPLSDAERSEVMDAPITWEERAAAYEAAWDAILLQIDRTFVRAVDTGVLDDFLGVSWRGAISANGSAATGALGGSIGGTST